MERADIINSSKTVQELAGHSARDHMHLEEAREQISQIAHRMKSVEDRVRILENNNNQATILLRELIDSIKDIKSTLVAPIGRGGFITETTEQIKATKNEVAIIKNRIAYWGGGIAVGMPIIAWVINKFF